MKRRSFIKFSALGTLALSTLSPVLSLAKEVAKKAGEKVMYAGKKFKYVADAVKNPPKMGKFKTETKKVKEFVKTNNLTIKDEEAISNCLFCSQFHKMEKDGNGKCKLINKGKDKDSWVGKNAWCQMYKPEKKLDKIKKRLS